MYKIRKTDDLEAVRKLHRQLFGKKVELDGTDHWLVWESGKDYPVGFCSGRKSTVPEWYFLSRAGVLPESRNRGLQKRLIRIRENRARELGLRGSLTYVANWNSASLINLLKAGYKVYDPATKQKNRRWRNMPRDGYLYLQKKLKKSKTRRSPAQSESPVSGP